MAHLLAAKSLGDIVDEDEWNELIGIPSSTQTITTAAYTILADARVIVLNPDADYTLTATPTITAGTYTGQVLRVICANAEANTLTFQDDDTLAGSTLELITPLRTLTGQQVMVLMWDGTAWVEQGTDEFGEMLLSGASPELTLKNLTAEDADNGRESGIRFKGLQSGSEETSLALIQASHDGAADDEKGKLEFHTNDTNDGDTPTLRITIDAAGNTKMGDGGTTNYMNVAVDGNPSVFDDSPELLLQNITEEDGDGGRESTIRFKGEQSGTEVTTLAKIEASHDGAADDEKGTLKFYTNDGNDGDSPTLRMVIDAAGTITMGDGGTTNYLNVDVAGAPSITNTSPELLLQNNTAEDVNNGRESGIRFKGIQSGNEVTTLALILADHAGVADDEKGALSFYVNDGTDGDSPTLRMNIDPNGIVAITSGVLALYETTTPSAVGSVGRLYTKADNLFYAQTGDGVEHAVSFDTADYAGIWVNDNAVATTILLVDAYEPVTVFDTDMPEKISTGANANYNITIGGSGDYFVSFVTDITSAGNTKTYEIDVFQIAAATQAITGATQANPCVVTATGHSFSNGNMVKFAGIGGMTELNGQIYTVANAGANDFELNDDNAANINSGAYGAYATPGTAQLATGIGVAHSHHTFGVGVDFGTMGGDGIATLVSGDTLELHVKGITDATNLTFDYVSFHIKRLS